MEDYGIIILYYEEVNFQLDNGKKKTWKLSDQRKIKRIAQTNFFLKLNMITSNSKVISFKISTNHDNCLKTFDFISSTINKLKRGEFKRRIIFMVLDNFPRNRSNF